MKTFLEIVDSSIINLAEMATNKIIKVSPRATSINVKDIMGEDLAWSDLKS